MQQEPKTYVRTVFEDFILRSAMQFKENTIKAEREKDETENCIGVVIFSWSYLEAYINNFINEEIHRFIEDMKPDDFHDMSTIQKYVFLSKIISGKTFTDQKTLESFNLLRTIRNNLIHYKGKREEVGDHVPPRKIENQCSNKFKIRDIRTDSLRKVLTKDCADWCLDTIVHVVNDFIINVYGDDVHLHFKDGEFRSLLKYLD